MRILFDQGTPVPLRRSLTGHVIATAYELGWSTVTNGELIRQVTGELQAAVAAIERGGYEELFIP
ncbi:MAG: hypothetical protein HQ527_00215 [Cyanobacteria bacterium]|nr:hypothetical protein [Cyanobacteria bacterium bin.51]